MGLYLDPPENSPDQQLTDCEFTRSPVGNTYISWSKAIIVMPGRPALSRSEVGVLRLDRNQAALAGAAIANWRTTARSTMSVEMRSMQFGTKSQLVL
jgi:hypothetical protein